MAGEGFSASRTRKAKTMDPKVYRRSGTVKAEQVSVTGPVSTGNGLGFANEGDYLVYGDQGTYVVTCGDFEDNWTEVKGDPEYSPAGKTVDQVIDFMRENPDQVDRIKSEEKSGGQRKGILNFASE